MLNWKQKPNSLALYIPKCIRFPTVQFSCHFSLQQLNSVRALPPGTISPGVCQTSAAAVCGSAAIQPTSTSTPSSPFCLGNCTTSLGAEGMKEWSSATAQKEGQQWSPSWKEKVYRTQHLFTFCLRECGFSKLLIP